MKRHFKGYISIGIMLLLSISLTICTYAGRWEKNQGSWFYLNDASKKETGLQKIKGLYYYLDSQGVMQTGWQKINEDWYYFKEQGNTAIGWEYIDGNWYYFANDGKMQTGWIQYSGKYYYLDLYGKMLKETLVDGRYWLDEWGRWNKYRDPIIIINNIRMKRMEKVIEVVSGNSVFFVEPEKKSYHINMQEVSIKDIVGYITRIIHLYDGEIWYDFKPIVGTSDKFSFNTVKAMIKELFGRDISSDELKYWAEEHWLMVETLETGEVQISSDDVDGDVAFDFHWDRTEITEEKDVIVKGECVCTASTGEVLGRADIIASFKPSQNGYTLQKLDATLRK